MTHRTLILLVSRVLSLPAGAWAASKEESQADVKKGAQNARAALCKP